MKSSHDCSSLSEIRTEIDRIDRQIIADLGERFTYVKAAARFKTAENDVAAPSRVAAMIEQRREWAGEAGLDSDVIEKIYRDLLSYFTSQERKLWHSRGA